MKKLLLLALTVLGLIIYSCMQDMPSEPPIGELNITAPLASDKFAIGDTVTIQAETIMSKLDRIDFFVDDVLKGSDKTEPFTCDWMTTGFNIGKHEIKTISYGAEGSITRNVKVDLIVGIAPDIVINEPADNSSFKIGTVVNIDATVTDSDGSVKSVSYFINDSLINSSNSAPFLATWNTAGLSEGNYSLKVTAKDNMGVVSSKQITVNLYLKVPACLLEYPINNSVYLYGQMVKIRAKATENLKSISTVKFYIDNNLVQTSTVADSGSYYFYNWNTVDQTVKNHQIKAVATDHNGRISTSNLIDIILNKAPTVDFSNPQNNQVIAVNSIVPVAVNALDADGTINNVKIFIDGVEKAVLTSAPFNYSWNTESLAIGNHTIGAVVTDDNGTMAEKEILVNLNAIPTVQITAPANGSSYLIGSNILIKTECGDNLKKTKSALKSSAKDKSVANVKFYINDVLKATDDIAPYEYLWNSTGSAVGGYNIKAVVTDDLGASAEQQIVVNLHNSPIVAITAPLNDAVITIGNVVNVTATAGDSKFKKGRTVSKVDFYIDGVLKGTDNSSPYSYSWNTAGIGSGVHVIKAVVTDNLDVTGEHQISVNLNAAPTVAITVPANGSYHLVGSNISIVASADDLGKKLFDFSRNSKLKAPLKNRSVANVKFYINNVLKATDDASPYEYLWNSTGLTVGGYDVKAVVTDDLGASAEQQIVVNLHTAPTVSITAPANDAVITIGSVVNVSASASDSKLKKGRTVSKVDFYVDGVLKGTDNSSPYSYSWNTAGIGSGVHYIKAVVTDNLDVTGEHQISVNLNAAPTVAITVPANGSYHLVGSNINIVASADDLGKKLFDFSGNSKLKAPLKNRSVTNVKFYINNVLKATDDASPYEYLWNSTGLAVGGYDVKAVVTDDLGASAEQQIVVNLHTAPTVSITVPANDAVITIGTVVNVLASAGDSKLKKGRTVSKVDFYVDEVLKGSDNSSPYSYSWNTAGIGSGVHFVKAVVTDNLNVTGEHQISVNLNAAPTVAITVPANNSSFTVGSVVDIAASAIDNGKKSSKIKGGFFDKVIASMKSVSKVEFYIDDVLQSTDETAPYGFAWNTAGVSIGSHEVKAIASDDQGATAEYQITVNLQSITWSKLYDNFIGNCISQLPDGNYLVGGYTVTGAQYNSYDCRLMKLGKDGNILIDKTYTTQTNSNEEYIKVVKYLDDGNFIIAGQKDHQLMVKKIDSNFDIVWEKTYAWGNNFAEITSLYVEANGDIVCLGSYDTPVAYSPKDIVMVKINQNGNVIWEKSLGYITSYYQISQRSNSMLKIGNFYYASITSTDISNLRSRIVKIDEEGNKVSEIVIDNIMSSELKFNSEGNYVMIGSRIVSKGNNSARLIEIDAVGNILLDKDFQKIGSFDNNNYGTAVDILSNGEIVFVGDTFSPEYNYWVVKTDVDGNKLWEKEFDAGYNVQDHARDLIITNDGGFVIAGYSTTNPSKLWILKLDYNGNFSVKRR